MAIIVNILNRGARVELINTDGKVVTFSDLPDGYHYEVMDICGTHIGSDIVGTKKARDAAIEFLQRKRYEQLARRIQAGHRPRVSSPTAVQSPTYA